MLDKLSEILSGGFGQFQNPFRDKKSAALTGLGLGLIGSPTHQIGQRALGGLISGLGTYGALANNEANQSMGLLGNPTAMNQITPQSLSMLPQASMYPSPNFYQGVDPMLVDPMLVNNRFRGLV